MASGLKEVGVQAVVKNVNGFISDIKRMTKSAEGMSDGLLEFGSMLSGMGVETFSDTILDLAGSFATVAPEVFLVIQAVKIFGDLLARDIKRLVSDFAGALKLVTNVLKFLKDAFVKIVKTALAPAKAMFSAVANSIRRIGEIATGILIANTIRKLGEVLSSAGQQALEAAIGFQTLEVRLQGLAARQFLNTGEVENFGEALSMATGKAEELLDWVIDLSLKSPISTEAVANTLTMATSYGLGADAAKEMTRAVLTFASGMGLTDVAQRRIIENFGQMIQQGKITGMELRDMARGAFVPVADLLQRTADLLGMTADEFDGTVASVNDFAGEKGLNAAMIIMEAFVDLTDEEFVGAIERMGNTIQGLRTRFKNLTGSIIGLNVLKPALDLIGGTIGKLFDKIAESDKIKVLSERIGANLKIFVDGLLNNLPSVETMVENIENFLARVASAMRFFREGDIMGGLRMLGVPESLLSFIDKVKTFTTSENFTNFVSGVITKFTELKDFWDEHGDTIITALKVAAGAILDALGIEAPSLDPVDDRGDPFEQFMNEGEGLNVETIIEKIGLVTGAVLLFIDTITGLPETIEGLRGPLALLGLLIFALRFPILSIGLAFLALPVLAGIGLASVLGKITSAGIEFYAAGKTLAQEIWAGFTAWWNETAVPWITRAMEYILGLLPAGLQSFLTGGVGIQTQAPTTVQRPSQSNTTNNNITVNADYAKTQSPVGISDDLSVLLSGTGP